MKLTGILYSEVYHPGFISLEPKKWFTFKYNNQLVAVAIDRHVDSLHAINTKNSFISDELEKEIYTKNEGELKLEYQTGKLNTKRNVLINYSEGQIVFSSYITVFLVAYESKRTDKGFVNNEMYQEIVEFFIHKYRAISRDYIIQLPTGLQSERYYVGRAFYEYTKKDKKLSIYSRLTANRNLQLSLGAAKFHNLIESLPCFSDSEIQELSSSFENILRDESSWNHWDFQEQLVNIAREINVQNNYKYALLESFVSCEQLISLFLRDIKIKKGVSKKKLDDYEKEVSISYQINVELPLVIDELSNTEKEILGKVDRIRKIRNSVVHRNSDVEEKDAIYALETLENLSELLRKATNT